MVDTLLELPAPALDPEEPSGPVALPEPAPVADAELSGPVAEVAAPAPAEVAALGEEEALPTPAPDAEDPPLFVEGCFVPSVG